MRRRDFLKHSVFGTTALAAAVGLIGRIPTAYAASAGPAVVNVMLLGGADLRHLFVPDPGFAPYVDRFWDARKALYQNNAANEALYQTYADVWADLYLPTTTIDGLLTFGIHNNAGWLKQQFDAGNVAIVANVLGSSNRRHDHSQLIVHSGDPAASQYVYDRDGWGGRLAHTIGAANVVSVTSDISVFCNGIDPFARNAKVVHAKDTRNFGLSTGVANPNTDQSALARALKAYYAERRQVVDSQPDDWAFRKFFQHEEALRQFGEDFAARLEAEAPIRPPALQGLYSGAGRLASSYFGRQCANLYDSFVGADLFQLRVASLNYGGWDNHSQQKDRFERNILDIFGAGKGLDTLTQELDLLGVGQDIVYVFNSDFGRQLKVNGDNGTDHGRGSYSILVGPGVNGGVYGEMFPVSEAQGNPGETRFDQRGADIEGRTSLERVLSEVCDWVEPGAGAEVFPGAASSILEPGVMPTDLFI